MNDLMDEGADAARELLERRDPAGEARPRTLVLLLMVEAYTLGYEAGRKSTRNGGRHADTDQKDR